MIGNKDIGHEVSTKGRKREKLDNVVGEYSRRGGGDLLPGFGDVVFEFIERRDTQLPLNVRQLPLLGCQHLGQSLDLILNLHTQNT